MHYRSSGTRIAPVRADAGHIRWGHACSRRCLLIGVAAGIALAAFLAVGATETSNFAAAAMFALANTAAPTISGTAEPALSQTVSTGTSGYTPTAYSYQLAGLR